MAVGTETPKKYQISWGFCFITKLTSPSIPSTPSSPHLISLWGMPSPYCSLCVKKRGMIPQTKDPYNPSNKIIVLKNFYKIFRKKRILWLKQPPILKKMLVRYYGSWIYHSIWLFINMNSKEIRKIEIINGLNVIKKVGSKKIDLVQIEFYQHYYSSQLDRPWCTRSPQQKTLDCHLF